MDSLGTILKSAREGLNLSLKEASERTKIRVHVLIAFEEGDFSILPPIYARSNIKTYAHFLRIPDNDINQYLDQIFKSTKTEKFYHSNSEEKSLKESLEEKFKKSIYSTKTEGVSRKNVINYLIYIGIGISLMVLLYFMFFSEQKPSNYIKQDEEGKKGPDTAVISEKGKGLLSFFEAPDSVILEAKALDTSWIRIDVDGKTSEVVHMSPNVSKRWSAELYFLLTVGNVGSIEFKRNGNILKPFGTKGTVVRNIKITKDEVINSSQPWTNADTSKAKRKVIKKEAIPQPKILEPSNIETYKPFQKDKKR